MTARMGRPPKSQTLPLRADIASWQYWVKAELARRGRTLGELARALNLSGPGLNHRLSMRAEWPVAHIRTLAEMLNLPLVDVLDRYPDMRHDTNRYITPTQEHDR